MGITILEEVTIHQDVLAHVLLDDLDLLRLRGHPQDTEYTVSQVFSELICMTSSLSSLSSSRMVVLGDLRVSWITD